MNKILTIEQAREISKDLRTKNKKIILTGGCFDILHPGHLQLLQHAKQKGDKLFVMLESDEKIKHLKGIHKPIFPQKIRAEMLAGLSCVDYVILLPFFKTNNDYDHLVMQISPTIIATTAQDPGIVNKKRQAEKIHAQVLEVTEFLPQYTTSKIIEILQREL